MAVRNPDGSVYQLGCLRQFNPNNPETKLFNAWDQEVIKIGGSPLLYYEVFINEGDIDPLYLEARNKIYSKTPIEIYGYYDPVPTQNAMGTFGIDSPEEVMFQFNYEHIKNTIGHAPRFGARIFSPHRRENWVVVQRNLDSFQMWGQIRLQVMCTKFQESLTTQEGKVTAQSPAGYKMNSVKDLSGFAGGQPLPE